MDKSLELLLADFLVEDLLNTPDEELLTELDGGELEAQRTATEITECINMAVEQARRIRLDLAIRAVETGDDSETENVFRALPGTECRRIWDELRSYVQDSPGEQITIAARNETDSSTSDLADRLHGFMLLGLIDSNGQIIK